MAKLSPIGSEFETTEEAEAYDAWFRAKVEKAMTSTEPGIPHDQVMAMVQEIIEQHRPR
ncbi:type II toxin-antitoxin system RelB family antitoxin [Sphingomonas sp. CFBP 8765]|uniref:type II toxin-antitoxin system RelB family antitoxin n=1 Tax=Sphingomonas sp. CFBP 8765 TaxID=2775274 RepID=UPI0017855E71|nr:stability determinant [Sphingomonas sp. CFBP 8765]MBD8469113.1 stability determinant [Sphingomonas sp. CFBP 8765]